MIGKEDYQKRLDEVSKIFSQMMKDVKKHTVQRCPYKDRLGQCTAKFGCRNQKKNITTQGLPLCVGDDKLNYRNAWEVG